MDINNIISYRNRAVNIGIIVLAIAISYGMYNKQLAVIESLKHTKDTEIKKNTALGGIAELEKRVKLYRDFVNKKDSSTLINSLNRIAREAGINITSLKPGRPQDFPMYAKDSFSIVITAKSFNQLARFISRLESHTDIFIIENLSVRPSGRFEEGESKDFLSADLTVNTVTFK
ncbi:MAG: type 4a pilus biogenesis protein PilO [Candidatus Omnitrophota bacterium]